MTTVTQKDIDHCAAMEPRRTICHHHTRAHVVVFDAHSPGAEAELDAGGPHDNVAHRVDQNTLPRTLVERQELAHAWHSVCQGHNKI